ncbi:uncharacterized protein LOC110978163 isoform X2 [Acanthaster planci]|uniref:Uncharacterized protein LOC110978163 isoform X2 n=1 Tax=Acanthaster planci TaxID=133434 RepID=A0A8B7Y8E8_ACAPL|nr:uncharacterized protein LOC110978163 isoform X2 [Acanthaster planci]
MGEENISVTNIETVIIPKLRRENDHLFEELKEAKQTELSWQRYKGHLLKTKELKAASAQTRSVGVSDVVTTLPTSSRKLFNQLYPQVDEIYHLELLLLELNQQLMVAEATREKGKILNALEKAVYEKNRAGPDDTADHACLLGEWFQQMSCVKSVSDPDLHPTMASKSESSIQKDRVFYWAKYETPSSHTDGNQTLSFSTRHCGICIRLCITAPNPGTMFLTSDIPLEGLQLGFQRCIRDGQLAHDFVISTVWRLIEDQILPFVST